jgi:hypothetical protein
VSGDNATSRFKSFQNTLLQNNKVSLDTEAAFTDVSDLSTLNGVKKHEAIVISFANTRRGSSITIKLVGFVEKFGGEDCAGTSSVALIKTANKEISWLRHTLYPMNLSPKDELAIENLDICWVCKKKLVRGMRKPTNTIIYGKKFNQGEVTS